MPTLIPSARAVNVVLFAVLSFIAGYATGATGLEAIRQVVAAGYAEVKAARSAKPACCHDAGTNPTPVACGCKHCAGKCADGGMCLCDPTTCMSKSGCNAWCPGK